MLVIADGGSTKVDWRFISERGDELNFETIGFNPFYFDSAAIIRELRKDFMRKAPVEQARQVFFYGAGASDEYRCSILVEAFKVIFPRATVEVDHDLLACARATCGDDPGIACILGTGSNSCLYDGKSVIDNVTNLGFYLGDEGSGSHLGKLLVTGYYYREMPKDLVTEFEAAFPMGRRELLNQIYGNSPNVYLASFSRFMFEHKSHFYIQKLVNSAFGIFIDRHVRKYYGHLELPIHFVGSIAYYFKDVLKTTLEERSLTLGVTTKKPIQPLVEYHLRKKQPN